MRRTPDPRYFVPDLSPAAREALKDMRPRVVFTGESPHIHEVEPPAMLDRRPFCGAAGKLWWSALGEVLEGSASKDVSLERMLALCKSHGVAMVNAMPYPLDPKVAKKFPGADPAVNLGFAKGPGSLNFKRKKSDPGMLRALRSLRERLNHPALRGLPIYPLGNDSLWLVTQALSNDAGELARVQGVIPHPAAWWRRGGHFGRVARERLAAIFNS